MVIQRILIMARLAGIPKYVVGIYADDLYNDVVSYR